MKKLKQKLLTGLTALTLSLTPATAMAEEKGVPHTDYFSVEATTSLVDNVQGLDGDNMTFGGKWTRRIPINENIGFHFAFAMAPKFGSMTVDLSIDNIVKNIEFYTGIGAAIYGKSGSFSFMPHAGIKFHIGEDHGIYLAGEFGALLRPDEGNLYSPFGLGVRFDLTPDKKE